MESGRINTTLLIYKTLSPLQGSPRSQRCYKPGQYHYTICLMPRVANRHGPCLPAHRRSLSACVMYTCPICWESVSTQQGAKSPQVLSCGHTFCASCLGKDLQEVAYVPMTRGNSKISSLVESNLPCSLYAFVMSLVHKLACSHCACTCCRDVAGG